MKKLFYSVCENESCGERLPVRFPFCVSCKRHFCPECIVQGSYDEEANNCICLACYERDLRENV